MDLLNKANQFLIEMTEAGLIKYSFIKTKIELTKTNLSLEGNINFKRCLLISSHKSNIIFSLCSYMGYMSRFTIQ